MLIRKSYLYNRLAKDKYFYGVILIFLFHLFINYYWLKQDNFLFIGDEYYYFYHSFYDFGNLKNITLMLHHPFTWLKNFYALTGWRGPFAEIVRSSFFFISLDEDFNVLVNYVIFGGLWLFSIYHLGRILLNKRAGFFSALVLSLCPAFFIHSRTYLVDLPLSALICLFYLIFFYYMERQSVQYIWFMGLIVLFGINVKINFIIFVLPAWIILFKEEKSFLAKKTLISLAAGIMPIFIFILLKYKELTLYLTHLATIILRITQNPNPNLILWYFKRLIFSIASFVEWNSSFLLFILFIIAAFRLRKKIFVGRLTFFIGLPLIIIVFCGRGGDGDVVRYLMPCLTPFCLIVGYYISGESINTALNKLIIPLLFIQFFAVSFGIPFLPDKIEIPDRENNKEPHLTFFKQKIHVTPMRHKMSHPYGDNDFIEKLENIKKMLRKESEVNISNQPLKVLFFEEYGIWFPLAKWSVMEKPRLSLDRFYVYFERRLRHRDSAERAQLFKFLDQKNIIFFFVARRDREIISGHPDFEFYGEIEYLRERIDIYKRKNPLPNFKNPAGRIDSKINDK